MAMKKEFFTNLEKKIDSLADKTLESWSERVGEDEFDNIESAILSFKYDTIKALEKELKKRGL